MAHLKAKKNNKKRCFFCLLEPTSPQERWKAARKQESRERVTKWMMCLPKYFKPAQAVHDVASLQGALARPAFAKFHVPIYRPLQQGRQCQGWHVERSARWRLCNRRLLSWNPKVNLMWLVLTPLVAIDRVSPAIQQIG